MYSWAVEASLRSVVAAFRGKTLFKTSPFSPKESTLVPLAF